MFGIELVVRSESELCRGSRMQGLVSEEKFGSAVFQVEVVLGRSQDEEQDVGLEGIGVRPLCCYCYWRSTEYYFVHKNEGRTSTEQS